MNVSVKIQNLKEVQAALKKSPKIVSKHINKAIDRSITRIMEEGKINSPSGFGHQLKTNWEKRVSTLRGETYPNVNYAIYVHEGTRPHWTSVKNLEGWARVKGVNPYAVQRSIAMKGTKANPFLRKAVDSVEGEINNIFKDRLSDALEEVAREAR